MRTLTRTVSPGRNSGILRAARRRSASSLRRVSITFMVLVLLGLVALCLLIGGPLGPQVWPALPRSLVPLILAPLADDRVVPGQQHLGDIEPFERPRPGV